MAVMSMRQVIGAINDKTEVKIYRVINGEKVFITRGNWFQDNILNYAGELLVDADLDGSANICTVIVG